MTPADRVSLLLIQSGDTFGTPERVVWELATRLPASRYGVHAWLSPAPALDELALTLDERGVAVERVAAIRSRWDVKGQAAAWKALRRTRPAIAHLHVAWPDLPRELPGLVRLAGAEHVILTVQGRVTPALPDLRPLLRAADALTAPCGPAASALAREAAVPRDRVRVVSNGADLPDEISELPAARKLRERYGAGLRRPLWVCATRLEEGRGHDVLLEALASLRARDLAFVAVLAGEGPRRVGLERRAAELGFGDAVRFVGQVESLGPLLLAADAFVLPSREEALPFRLLEAMARGRPVVVTDAGGIPEAVEDGVHGHVVPVGDVAALADALASLHTRSDAARRMGQRAAERVRSAFTWARIVEAYECLYDDVLGLTGFTPEGGAKQSRPSGARGR